MTANKLRGSLSKQDLKTMLRDFGVALAENKIPLTFIVGEHMELGRVDILNDTEPGKIVKDILKKEVSTFFKVPYDDADDLLITYYLMTKTSILVEHTGHSTATGMYQPAVDRAVMTLDEDEVKLMYRLHGVAETDIPDKAWRDLNNVLKGIIPNYNVSKIKGLRLDWKACKTTNPRALMDYDDGVHITPVDVLVGYHFKLREMVSKDVLRVTYKRVNLVDRKQHVTTNADVINDVYRNDLGFANRFLEESKPPLIDYHGTPTTFSVINGLWATGDLGLSRFGYSPKRHISLTRITGMEYIDESELQQVKKYVNVDMDNVDEMFIIYYDNMTEDHRQRVRQDVNVKEGDLLENHIQTQVAIFTSTYRRWLHDYMMLNQDMFKGYTGIKQNSYDNSYTTKDTKISFGSTAQIDF